ncbi:unnamed protein product [Knipowitschia caucasica]
MALLKTEWSESTNQSEEDDESCIGVPVCESTKLHEEDEEQEEYFCGTSGTGSEQDLDVDEEQQLMLEGLSRLLRVYMLKW